MGLVRQGAGGFDDKAKTVASGLLYVGRSMSNETATHGDKVGELLLRRHSIVEEDFRSAQEEAA